MSILPAAAITLLMFCTPVHSQTIVTSIGTPRACAPKVEISRQMIPKATVNTANTNWRMQIYQSQNLIQAVQAQSDGVTFLFTASLTPGLDYSFTYDDPSLTFNATISAGRIPQ